MDEILMMKGREDKSPDSNAKYSRNHPKLVAANLFLAANSANEG